MCDFCGLSTDNEWKQDRYDDIEVELDLKIGERFPEASFGKIISFDMCPDCFKDKLIPWAKTQGAEPTVKDYDC